ncbi:hypothetical protein [Arsenophonus endosymbiont of Aleurodicus floccissimus]|nr:hypothetical protein [Arsenophonus endosymbiont of Aleurodicus floccissimus]
MMVTYTFSNHHCRYHAASLALMDVGEIKIFYGCIFLWLYKVHHLLD